MTFPAFGKLRDLESQPFRTWFAYFADYVARYLRAAGDLNVIDTPMRRRLAAVLDRSRPMLERVVSGSLVHSDFRWENVLVT